MTPEQIIAKYRKRPDQPTAGKKFGYSVVMLKQRIYERLIARGMEPIRAHFRVSTIYERIMRYYPSFSEYCAAKRAVAIVAPATGFTVEQLQHIADMWADANDPISRDCAAVASALIARL